MDEWVLFLGAGASVAAPTRLPAFPALARGVLGAVGWSYRSLDGKAGVWEHPRFPSFVDPGSQPGGLVSPEVLFGTLQTFGVDFASEVARVLGTRQPNAAHRVAAEVLAAGGCVWTTNVDLAIEGACLRRGGPMPPRFGRRPPARVRARREHTDDTGALLLAPLSHAGPGGLVKFHGTAEDPLTLAFTDRELLTPLPTDEVERLSTLVPGHTLVFYGYAGADADLADLLEAAMAKADRVLWFEPDRGTRDTLRLFFPAARDAFVPADLPPGDFDVTVPASASAFLSAAASSGYQVADDDDPRFTTPQNRPPDPDIDLPEPPGITHARLVERFGFPVSEDEALSVAWRQDKAARQWDLWRAYARWAFSRSLYRGGIAAGAVRSLSAVRPLLLASGVGGIRDAVILREFALLLTAGKWRRIDTLAQWSLRHRRRSDGSSHPSDHYYRAYARRYAFDVAGAAADAETAVRGLADALDPERLAGALLESGIAAIYQGRFADALRRAFELQYRRGRFAIRRWQSWGGWLEAVAYCHRQEPQKAQDALDRAVARFTDERIERPLADVETIRLLTTRVWIAQRDSAADDSWRTLARHRRTPRQMDDLHLVLGDLELAADNVPAARTHYQTVADNPSCPIVGAWSALGLAEATRLEGGVREAAEAFEEIAQAAQGAGATWLEAQAVLGLHYASDPRADSRWQQLRPRLANAPATVADLAVGEPRILWTLS